MIKTFATELYKVRRRKVWLVVAGMIAAQMVWELWSLSYMDAEDLQQGWLFTLYQFPVINALMMPVIAAVVASRLSDIEHKGQTFRLIHTLMTPGRLFDIKFLNGAVYMLAAVLLQVAAILITGSVKGFVGEAPIELIGCYLLFTVSISLVLLLLQQVLSLLYSNQMVALTMGLFGAFFGLFSLFFPAGFQKLVPWGYYGVLMFVGLDWDRATRISNYYLAPIDWASFGILIVQFVVIYGIGRFLFVKKEV